MTKKLRFLPVIVLLFATFFGVIFSAPLFAYDDTTTGKDANCGAGKTYCYAYKKSQGGGIVWLYIPQKYVNFASKEYQIYRYSMYVNDSAWYPAYPSGVADCKLNKADGIFVLAAAWHKSGTSQLTGYFSPAAADKPKKALNYPGDYLNVSYSYSDGVGVATQSLDEIEKLYLAWTEAEGYTPEQARQRWNDGDFNYFCGEPTMPETYSSMTNVWLDKQNATGLVSNNTELVSSDFKDGETNVVLEVTAEPGAKIPVAFNSYIKTTQTKGGKTDYKVEHTCEGASIICGRFADANFIPQWKEIVLPDTEQKSAITNAGKDTYHTFEIPQTDAAGTTYKLCEKITYKKKGKSSDETAETHACMKITVGEGSLFEGKTDLSGSSGSTTSDWGVANEAAPLTQYIQATAGSTQQVNITFKHWLRSSSSNTLSSKWTITPEIRTLAGSGVGIASSPSPSTDSGTLTTSDTQPRQVGGNRTYTINVPAVSRITTFRVCETLTFQTRPSSATQNGWTKACYVITVTPEPNSGACPVSGSYAPPAGSKSRGTTTVWSGAKNLTLSGSNHWAGYVNTGVYAKITDNIGFAHCYYPESQAVMSTYRGGASNHPHCFGWFCPSYPDMGYVAYVALTNQFNISSSDDKLLAGGSASRSKVIFSPGSYYHFSSSNPSFSVGSGYSATFRGPTEVGDTSSTVVHSYSSASDYNVRPGSAGAVVQQTISASNASTESHDPGCSWVYECHEVSCATEANPSCTRTVCTYAHHTSYYVGSTSGSVSDSAWIYIPYNFKTSLGTDISGTNANGGSANIVLSNEDVKVSSWVRLEPRTNNVTKGTYATEPPADTTVEVVSFFLKNGDSIPSGSTTAASGPCTHFGTSVNNCKSEYTYGGRDSWMGINNWPSTSGTTYNEYNGNLTVLNVNVPNIPTGYKFCTAIGISHTDSGDDTNTFSAPGNTPVVSPRWNISNPTCRTVANRPNLQVWGGSLYTNGNVQTSTHTKSKTGRFYGSWGEFALVVGQNGKIEGMSSGAALGYDKSYDNTEHKGGAAIGLSFCSRSPLSLTMVNSECSYSGSVNPSGIVASGNTLYKRLKDRYVTTANHQSIASGYVNLSFQGSGYIPAHSENYIANEYRLTVLTGEATISTSGELPSGQTHIIYAKGNLTIATDLKVREGPYSDIADIPQYIILADGDVRINGDVTQVDAWIISGNTGSRLSTCGTDHAGNGANASSCGNVLKINGPVVIGAMDVDRAGGNGAEESTGEYRRGQNGAPVYFNDVYSPDPAEIFNLSPTNYFWAYAQATKFSQVNTVYTRELAPRL